ncbi:hypothetical protein [Hydrogenimonas sp.]
MDAFEALGGCRGETCKAREICICFAGAEPEAMCKAPPQALPAGVRALPEHRVHT